MQVIVLAEEIAELRLIQEKAMKDSFGRFQEKNVGMMNTFIEKLTCRLEKAELEIEALKMQNTEQAERFLHWKKTW